MFKKAARECEFVEVEVGRWYYILQQENAPPSTWDWREHAKAFGPFTSVEDACEHLSSHYRFSDRPPVFPLPVGAFHADLNGDRVLKSLVAHAGKNMAGAPMRSRRDQREQLRSAWHATSPLTGSTRQAR